MKSLFLFCLFLFVPKLLDAQSFTIAVSPKVQTASAGQNATYSITITPHNGFNSTVFLSLSSMSSKISGEVTFSSSTPNFPYSNVTLIVKPTFLDSGTKHLTIVAKNGMVEDSASCSLNIPTNVQWTRLSVPQHIPLGNPWDRSWRIDKDGNMCFVDSNNGKIFINHFRNKHWETDTILTTFEFDSGEIPFLYDKSGILWFGTNQGIARYDGKFINVYNKSNSGLTSDKVRCIEIDKNGYLVCLAKNDIYDISIARFDGTVWKSIEIKKLPTSPQSFGERFCIDSLNQIWITVENLGLYKIQDTTVELVRIDGVEYNNRNAPITIVSDSENGIWCSYYYGYNPDWDSTMFTPTALSHFDGTSWKHIQSPTNYGLHNFLIDSEKNIWIASNGGLYKYNGKEWTTYNNTNAPLLDPKSMNGYMGSREVIQDNDKNLWFSTVTMSLEVAVFNPNGLVNIPIVPLAVEEQTDLAHGITVFPNPSTAKVTIIGLEGSSTVRIANSLGNQVLTLQSEGNNIEIDVSSLPNGLYFASIRTATGMVVKPIVISR